MRPRLLLLAGAAVLVAGCAGVAAADAQQERTVLIDYDHDEIASTFMAYFPSQIKMHAGDEVVFRQQWTGEGHSVTMGTYVDEAFEIGRPLMEEYPDEEPPPEVVAPFYEIYQQLPLMLEERLNVNQNGAQPCYLDEGLPPANPDTPCSPAQQRQPAFNGRQSYYNSGFIPYEGPRGNEYRVRLSDDIRPGTYSYYCNLHEFFQNGMIEVVPDSEPIPSQAQVSREAYAQIKETAAPLLRAYRQAVAAEGETEIVGLTVRKPFAGWFPDTEETPAWINEFVPQRTEITAGQSLTWSFVGGHTVSFDVPAYFSEFVVEPDGTVEWSQDAVAPQGRRLVTDAPSDQPTGAAAGEQDAEPNEDEMLEIEHVDAGRWDGEGFLSSGIQGGGTYAVTFTRPGTYPYACLIHPRMVGEVVVR
jgi:plastocyanin